MKNKIVLFYVPFPSEKSVKEISNQLLEDKLAVCVQSHAVDSKYIWNNKISQTKEWVAIFKTNIKNKKSLARFIKKNHPYDVPCIIKLEANVNKKYAAWMDSSRN